MQLSLQETNALVQKAATLLSEASDKLALMRSSVRRGKAELDGGLLKESVSILQALGSQPQYDLIGANLCAIFRRLASQLFEISQSGNTVSLVDCSFGIEDLASNFLDIYERASRAPLAPRRMDLINAIIKKYGYHTYLEIGCNDDSCFREITVPHKVGVDPVTGGTVRATSDEFFKVNTEKFDMVFVDGLHTAEQVRKDVENALKILNPNGTIMMHDCNPRFEIRQIVPERTGVWNGDVWRTFLALRSRGDLDSATANFDHGCGVIRVRNNSSPIMVDNADWDNFSEGRAKLLRLMTFEEIKEWV